MPPGPKRRKAVKKKNKNKPNKNSVSSPAPHLRHGESDGGQVSSPASKAQHKSPQPEVKAEKRESNLSIETNEKVAKEKQGKIESDEGSSSQTPHEKSPNSRSSSSDNKSPGKKKSVVIEPATVADYLAQPIESSSLEKGKHKVEGLAGKTPSSVHSTKPVDQSLVEKKDDLVVPETSFGHTLNKCSTSTTEVIRSIPKENEVQNLGELDENPSPKVKDNYLIPDSKNVKCPYCGKSSDDRVNEPVTPESSERQPLLASAPPQAAEKSSWKSCCGIFELFSGSRSKKLIN